MVAILILKSIFYFDTFRNIIVTPLFYFDLAALELH